MIRCTVVVSRKLLAVLLVPVSIMVIVVGAVQLPSNVLHMSGNGAGMDGLLTELFPQGWAFFTRTPREEQDRVYALRAHRLISLDRGPFSQLGNLAGLDRTSRRQGPELSFLLRQVGASKWSRCSGSDDECMRMTAAGVSVRNPEPNPTYCGQVLVLGSDIVPWAYRKMVSGPAVNTRVVRLDVRCES